MKNSPLRILTPLIIFYAVQLQAQHSTDSLKELLKSSEKKSALTAADTTRLNTFEKLSRQLFAQYEYSASIGYCEQGISFADQMLTLKLTASDSIIRNVKAGMLSTKGAALISLGNFTTAIESFNECLQIRSGLRQIRGTAKAYLGLAKAYYLSGHYPEALDVVYKSMKKFEQAGDKKGTASALNYLGAVYIAQYEYDKALDNFKRALVIQTAENNTSEIANLTNNIGIIYKQQDNYLLALEWFRKALALRIKMKDKVGEGTSYNNIGIIYDRVKNYPEALKYHELSLKIKEQMDDKEGTISSCINIGNVLMNTRKNDQALVYFYKAYELSKEMNSLGDIRDCCIGLYNTYLHKGDYRQTYEFYQKYILFRDSVTNLENTKQMLQSQVQYEYDKKALADSIKTAGEKEVFAVQLKQERTAKTALYGGLALVALFAGFMYNRFRITRKQKQIIHDQKVEVEAQKAIVEHAKETIEEKQKEILDSINYAKRIQYALLANHELIDRHIPENFILFMPKDIVSGDFYWATSVVSGSPFLVSDVPGKKHFEASIQNKETRNQELFYLAACDSTGHGVPGAFMSLLNIGFLSEAINEKEIRRPNEVFNYVRERLVSSISREGQKDGFDGVLACLSGAGKGAGVTLTYTAANNPPVLVNRNGSRVLDYDRMPVGKGEKSDGFTLFEVACDPGDMIYFFTDGYADQFGGPKGKKLKFKQLEQTFIEIREMPLTDQKEILLARFQEWRGNLEQVDDVCIIGIRV